jgi:hypothetical protein
VPNPFHILAADDNIGKVVGAVIFVVIWIASAIASAVKKKQEEEKRRKLAHIRSEVRDALTSPSSAQQPSAARRPPPLPEAILRQLPNPLPPVSRPAKGQPAPRQPAQRQAVQRQATQRQPVQRHAAQRQPNQPKKKIIARQPAAVAQPSRPVAVKPPAPRPDPAPAKPIATPSANAANIHRWLTPKTLHQQFILTEILQPPRAFRDQIME